METEHNPFSDLKILIATEKTLINKIYSLEESLPGSKGEQKQNISSQISSLIEELKSENQKLPKILEKISLIKKLPTGDKFSDGSHDFDKNNFDFDIIKKEFSDKAKIKADKKTIKEKKPSFFVYLSNKLFADFALSLERKGHFESISGDLKKANINLLPKSYISVMFFSTIISIFVALFLQIFLLFFSISLNFPFLSFSNEPIFTRFLKTFWILGFFPLATYTFSYFFPTLERRSLDKRIGTELPFVAINMSAISNSMVDPTKIFRVIISTKEYPLIQSEFIKIINEVNLLGYNLVNVLRRRSEEVPNPKLGDLFNGLATTINSGGNLSKFFDERAKALLFDYNLEKEKSIRVAETFMDIYISVVIAAPMILMLLLVIIQISGIGVSLSIPAITLIIIFVVSIINVFFILFLRLRQN